MCPGPRILDADLGSLTAVEFMPPLTWLPLRTVTVTVLGCNASLGTDTGWSPAESNSDGEHSVIRLQSGPRHADARTAGKTQVPWVLQCLSLLDQIRPGRATPGPDPQVLVPPPLCPDNSCQAGSVQRQVPLQGRRDSPFPFHRVDAGHSEAGV